MCVPLFVITVLFLRSLNVISGYFYVLLHLVVSFHCLNLAKLGHVQTLLAGFLIFRYRLCSLKKDCICLEIPSFAKLISGIPHSGVISAAKASNSALALGVLYFGSLSFHLLAANRPIFFLLSKKKNVVRIFKKTTVLKRDDKYYTFCNLLGQVKLSHLWCKHGHVRH